MSEEALARASLRTPFSLAHARTNVDVLLFVYPPPVYEGVADHTSASYLKHGAVSGAVSKALAAAEAARVGGSPTPVVRLLAHARTHARARTRHARTRAYACARTHTHA